MGFKCGPGISEVVGGWYSDPTDTGHPDSVTAGDSNSVGPGRSDTVY